MGCLSQTDADDTDDADGNEETLYAAGGVKQQTTKAASHGKAYAITDDGTISHPTTDAVIAVDDTGTVTAEADSLRFISALIAMALAGMGMVTFGALAFGKSGLYFSGGVTFILVGFGIIDIAMMMTINAPASQATGQPATQPNMQNLSKRALCWLSIAILQGALEAGWSIAFDQKRTGTIWQLELMLYNFGTYFYLSFGGVVVQAHKDRRPTIMVWCGSMMASGILRGFSDCSPYPELSALGSGLLMLTLFLSTFGLYFVVMHIDKKAERCDVRRGYQLLVSVGLTLMQFLALKIRSQKSDLGGALDVSVLLAAFQQSCLKCFIPMSKRCFGDDRHKLWTCAIPACMLVLELGPCLLLLGEDFTTRPFWALLICQELSSAAKNTGKYGDVYVGVRALLRRPVDEDVRKRMEERRQTIAPCDNIAEVASPVVILVAIALEGLFDILPIERARYLADADKGILGGWRSQRFRGEAPIMMIIVLAARLIFCWIELTVRRMQRRNGDTDNTTVAEIGIEDVRSDDKRAVGATKSRRSSMTVLYNRIVRSEEAPVEMKYMTVAAFAFQAVLFVYNAAAMGRKPNELVIGGRLGTGRFLFCHCHHHTPAEVKWGCALAPARAGRYSGVCGCGFV